MHDFEDLLNGLDKTRSKKNERKVSLALKGELHRELVCTTVTEENVEFELALKATARITKHKVHTTEAKSDCRVLILGKILKQIIDIASSGKKLSMKKYQLLRCS